MHIRFRNITIEIVEGNLGGYIAEVKGRPHLYGYGRSFIHAVGDLVIQFPKVFGVKVQRKQVGKA